MYYFDSVEPAGDRRGRVAEAGPYRAKRQGQAHRAYLTALAALVALRKLLPAPVVEAVAAPEKGPAAGPGRNGHGVNGHAAKSDAALPPCIQDRLAGLFGGAGLDEPARSTRERVPVAAEN